VNIRTKQNFAITLALLSAVGTVATGYLTREAAKKEVKTYNGVLPYKKGNFIDIIKIYKYPLLVGGVTVSSIIGSTIMSRKAEASLLSMAVMADQGWRRYKHQVKDALGIEAHENIVKGIAKKNPPKIKSGGDDDLTLYYDEIIGYFQAKPEDMMYAYATMNEMLTTSFGDSSVNKYGGITLMDFVRLSKARLVNDVDEEILTSWGWGMDYLNECYGEIWIHMGFSPEKTDDDVIDIVAITWLEEPVLIMDYDDNLDAKFSHEETRKLVFNDYIEDGVLKDTSVKRNKK